MRFAALIALLGALALALPASASAASPNLRTTISDAPDPVGANNFITYTIDVKNTGTTAAQNVVLKVPTPAGTHFQQFQGAPGWGLSGPDNSGTIAAATTSLAAGATAEFTMVVRVDAAAASGATIKGSASVSSNPADPFPRDNKASATTTVQRAALTVTNTDSPDPVAPGHDITYQIGVANNGKTDANSVAIKDAVPLGTTFVSAAAPSGWLIFAPAVGGTGDVTFSNSAEPGQTGSSVSITVHVDPATVEGATISDTASVTSSSTEDNTSDNSATVTTLVSSKADLETAMTVTPPGAVDPNSDLTYGLTVTNRGDVDAQAVTLDDQLPAGTTFVSAAQTQGPAFFCNLPTPGATGTIHCNRATLDHTESAAFTVVVHVDPGAGGRTIDNTATAASSTADLNPANDSATRSTRINGSASQPPPPAGAADLAIVKPSTARVRHGHKKTLRIAVTNPGTAVATAARLRVKLPKRLKLVKAKGCSAKKRLVVCRLGDLAAGGKSVVKLVVRPKRRGIYKLKARATSATPDANAANNAATLKLKAR
jgi:uncharacterized repeat protein (TIGR01451 family)